MGLPVRPLLVAAAIALALPAPAEAKLGDSIERFSQSKLLQGDRLFRFEGRVGARYRFTGARHCAFGQGILAVDVDNQRIVQQILVLPLPANRREESAIREVAGLFIDDLGLDLPPKELRGVMDAFNEGLQGAKLIERPVGKYELRVMCQPQLGSVMMRVALKP